MILILSLMDLAGEYVSRTALGAVCLLLAKVSLLKELFVSCVIIVIMYYYAQTMRTYYLCCGTEFLFSSVVTCGRPETKDDKTIVEGSSRHVGGKASYACSHGYELVGDEVRTCQSNGEWSGEIPYCRREFSRFFINRFDMA